MRIATAIFLLLTASSLAAHHGNNANPLLYFADDLVELEGEITDVLWRNPHTRARLTTLNEEGVEATWELELQPPPRRFEGMGLFPEDFRGTVKVAGHISRRNPRSLGVLYFLLPDGREYVQGRAREPRWSSVRVLNEGSSELDPAKVKAAEAAADGIFRMWGGLIGPRIEEDLRPQSLTERGSSLADAYDPLTDNGQLECRHGMPDTMFDPVPMEISNEGNQYRIHVAQFNIQRVVHMDAGSTVAEPEPSPVGYSVGRWEDETLVVETSHVDWPYYSGDGTPQSDQVRYVERFSVSNDGQTLNYSITVSDPEIFAAPFTMERSRAAAPGTEIEPFNCLVNWKESE